MAIGDTVQAGLGRMDFSAFKTAGEAQAQANQAFGKAIEKAAIGFFQGQEKKKKKQEMVQGLTMLFPDAPPELVNAMAKNPEVTEAKLNLDRFNLEVDKFNQQKKVQLDQFNLDSDKFDQQKKVQDLQIEQIQNVMQNTQADRLQEEQNRKDTENFYNFMGKPGPDQIDPSGPDRNSVLRNIRKGKGVTPPARMIPGSLPAEQLVVSEEAKAFIRNAIKQGQPIGKAITIGQQIDQQIERTQPKAPTINEQIALLKRVEEATEFEQGQDAITFTPERNAILLGDTAYGISGKFGNEAEVINLKSVEIPNYSNMNTVMNQLISLGEKRKTTKFMSNADKTLAASLSRQLQGLLREEILGPGTVTDPERAILEQIVQNPTTWMDTAGNTQSKIDSLKGIRKNAFNKLKTRLTGLGLDVAEIGQADAISPSKSSVNFDQETSSGLGYTEINLDQL